MAPQAGALVESDKEVSALGVCRKIFSTTVYTDGRSGSPTAQVEDIVHCGSPRFPRKYGDPNDYLRRTLARPLSLFPPQGATV
jgi:hypothetical protein